jgi:antirestriction protein ArdC
MSSYRKGSEERVDQYQKVTDQIVAALEKGTAPWVCPWDKGFDLPRNGSSNRPYSGINVLMLWASGCKDPRHYTYRQAQEIGGHVRRGEHGTTVIKWLFLKGTQKDTDGNVRLENGQPVTKTVPILKTYTVFNHSQIEWDAGKEPKREVRANVDPAAAHATVDAFVKGTGAKVRDGLGRACYSPLTDDIGMPSPASFKDVGAYWGAMLHELTHWTGHASRCKRSLDARFGSESYAAEELVAELGSAFLCADFGISGTLQHPEYIGNWIQVLKGDKYALFTAARLAREAMAFLKPPKAEEAREEEAEAA